jgi:hypothetical protein
VLREKAINAHAKSLDIRQAQIEAKIGSRKPADLYREIAAERTRAAERRIGRAQLASSVSAFRLLSWS